MNQRLPKIFVVGAAKCGTTSLWAYLKQHPQLSSTEGMVDKELGLYCNLFGTNDKEYYLSLFKPVSDNSMNFEVCTSYLTSPESPSLIKQDVPDAKIIAIIRNPVNRAFSLYHWMTANGYEHSSTFKKALAKEHHRIKSSTFRKYNAQYFYNYLYKTSGLYHLQLRRYVDVFGVENVHVIIYEDFIAETQKYLNQVCEFLQIEKHSFQINKVHNKGKSVRSPFIQFFSRLILLRTIGKLFIFRGMCQWFYKLITKLNTRAYSTKPDEKSNSALTVYYKSEMVELDRLLNKSISSKWFP